VLSLCSALSAAVGVARRRRDLLRLALGLLIAVGAMMPVVFIAGVRAADSIGKVDGVQQEAIAPHRNAAIIALTVSIATAVIGAVLLRIELRGQGLSRTLRVVALAATIAAAAPIGWTANLGGLIHHPEINAASP